MPRPRKIHAGMLNIVSHPHTQAGYLDLFTVALRHPVSMGGDSRAMIGTWAPIHGDPLDGIEGSIFRYTEIDMEHPWLDTISGKKIEPEQLDSLVSVPASLKPSFSTVWFNFFPKSHRLVFEIEKVDYSTRKKISFKPSTAQLFFQRLFNRIIERTKFHTVTVTIVQDHETLRKIFTLHHLSKLEIVINRPNPTDGSVEERLARSLEREKVNIFQQLLVSKDPTGLQPSDNTRALANIASSNGYVEASGTTAGGQKVHLKTIEKPVEGIAKYQAQQGLARAFYLLAKELIDTHKSQ